jgi:hypothetical protein
VLCCAVLCCAVLCCAVLCCGPRFCVQVNVLVATCIGEEGLDIGAVDLVVFYDSVGSPIRWVHLGGGCLCVCVCVGGGGGSWCKSECLTLLYPWTLCFAVGALPRAALSILYLLNPLQYDAALGAHRS